MRSVPILQGFDPFEPDLDGKAVNFAIAVHNKWDEKVVCSLYMPSIFWLVLLFVLINYVFLFELYTERCKKSAYSGGGCGD